ncbi:uL15 family ribosomal protein [Patescibacteria group bacterium]|nr:uL15 family ribosomal protein [Patescibacteria group bacterium]
MTLKVKKRKKNIRMRGKGMGTHGGGARKKRKKSGHRGGVGMSGSGKRADHKKTLITKLYGSGYFGKQGITSKKTERDKRKRINLFEVELNLEKYLKKGIAKKTSSGVEINLKDYKILGGSNRAEYVGKEKITIIAKEASKSAIEKIKESGGEIILLKKLEKRKGKELIPKEKVGKDKPKTVKK